MFQTDGEIAFEEAVRHVGQSGIAIDGLLPGDEADIATLEKFLRVRLPPSYGTMVRPMDYIDPQLGDRTSVQAARRLNLMLAKNN